MFLYRWCSTYHERFKGMKMTSKNILERLTLKPYIFISNILIQIIFFIIFSALIRVWKFTVDGICTLPRDTIMKTTGKQCTLLIWLWGTALTCRALTNFTKFANLFLNTKNFSSNFPSFVKTYRRCSDVTQPSLQRRLQVRIHYSFICYKRKNSHRCENL